MKLDTTVVPRNGCVRCCQGEAVEVNRKFGDQVSSYHVERHEGTWILAHKPNGDCVYLGPQGCTIWRRRPAVCRSFDCRTFVRDVRLDPALHRIASRAVVAQGRRLLQEEEKG